MYEQIGQINLGRSSRGRASCCTPQQDEVSVPSSVNSVSSSSDSSTDEETNCYKSLGDYLYNSHDYAPQSEVVVDDTKHDTTENVEGLVTFLERQELSTVGSETSSVLHNVTENTYLGKFLSRPVKIDNFTWNESDTIGTIRTLQPWSLWTSNTVVQNKLNNYAFMRGDLKIKVQLSASPFYYGLILMNYRPLTTFRDDTIYQDSANNWLILASQRPHVKIDPENGDTYEMTLPFLYQYNMVTVGDVNVHYALGTLQYNIYSVLRSANGVTGSGITITTYAWMENLELSGATAAYAAQSDEYGTGCVSKPASWVADIAGRLESVPGIGLFATATRIGASAVSSIASMFGFTNVPVIDDTIPHRPEAFPKFASTEIGFPIEKLTLDPKNELSVDPRIFGMPSGEDEMAIASITSRESYLCTTNWSTADAADTIKFSCLVHPNLSAATTITGGSVLQNTPLSYATAPFDQWRGDIVITLRVIASKYHRGKLKISFDPAGGGSGYNLITNANTVNVVQTAIMDIGENREIEFTVPYQNGAQFLSAAGAYSDWSTSSTPTLVRSNLTDNGYFTVRVQNALTAPVGTSSVDILVFIKGGNNYELANPDELDSTHRVSFFQPQSDDYISLPVNGKVTLGDVSSKTANQYLVHYGEQIVSFRQLLHRYNVLQTDYINPDATANVYQYGYKILGRMPITPGYISTAYTTANKQATGTYGFNFCELTLLSWISNAFLGYRGSTNYSFNVGSNIPVKNLSVMRTKDTNANFLSNSTVCTTLSQLGRATMQYSGARGMAVTNQVTQAGLNVTCPMYAREKFMSCDAKRGNVPGPEDVNMLGLKVELPFPSTQQSDKVLVRTFIATSPDFSLHFFMNVPSIFVYNTFPAAA